MTPPSSPTLHASAVKLPKIAPDDPFVRVAKALAVFFVEEIQTPATFDQLRAAPAGNKIRILVEYLVVHVTNPVLINALLTLKLHFSTLEIDDRGLNETRACACEIVAWRFLNQISERDVVNFCLYDLPQQESSQAAEPETRENITERSNLLPQFRNLDHGITARPGTSSQRKDLLRSVSHMGSLIIHEINGAPNHEEDPSFIGLNGLEIAAVADCKKFLSQRIVQKVITGIWNGDITFWETLSSSTKKKAQFYSETNSDIFTRLRVPRYIKLFEVLFFATFLLLYYAVLVERNPNHITPIETTLYIWFAAFAYEELGQFIDAGSKFYAVDIWSGCDLIIILIGMTFIITRIIGIKRDNGDIVNVSFDILSLEALFMVPRICSLLSLHPYFGTLIPCLKAMVKDFVKFMVVVAVLYIGFLTTFTLLARDSFTLSEMSWILVKVFFGSSSLGFDIMNELIFVCMTNILLITSLISILTNSFSKVIAQAREEYLFVYSVYVLEASTSNRLTHFYPPLNLIPLVFIRPLRVLTSSEKIRRTRIVLLKITHLPILAIIKFYESIQAHAAKRGMEFSSIEAISGVSDRSPKITVKKQQQSTSLPSRVNTMTSSQHLPDLQIGGGDSDPEPHHTYQREPMAQADMVAMGNLSLEQKVDVLTEKIAQLTALIIAQQGHPV